MVRNLRSESYSPTSMLQGYAAGERLNITPTKMPTSCQTWDKQEHQEKFSSASFGEAEISEVSRPTGVAQLAV